jgi:hypothetical protein
MGIYSDERIRVWFYALLVFPLVIIFSQLIKSPESFKLSAIGSLMIFSILQIFSSFLSFAITFIFYCPIVNFLEKRFRNLQSISLLILRLFIGIGLFCLYELIVLGSFLHYDTFNGVRFTVVRCISFSIALLIVHISNNYKSSKKTLSL